MAANFTRTFALSAAVSLMIGALFYLLAAGKRTASSAYTTNYTTNDVSMGVLFVVLLALIIGLSLWPSILERRPEEKEQ